MSDNRMQVTIKQAKSMVEKMITFSLREIREGRVKNGHHPLYLHSSPGVGKSSIIRQIAEKLGIGLIDQRLSAMQDSDVQGIPYVLRHGDGHDSKGECVFGVPEWFPSVAKVESGKIPAEGILFLDELSNSPINTQQASYRVILDRQVHDQATEMAPGWVIIAAGNLTEDMTGVKKLAPALANRFATHIFIKPDHSDFIGWAINNDIHPDVIGFCQKMPNFLHKFDANKNDVAFPTPRTWESVSNLLKMGYSEDELAVALSGCVGAEACVQFNTYRKTAAKLPDFEQIMAGKEKYTVPKDDMGVHFAIISTLLVNMNKYHDDKVRLKRLGNVMDQLKLEHQVLIWKTLRDYNSTTHMGSFVGVLKDSWERVSKQIPAVKE